MLIIEDFPWMWFNTDLAIVINQTTIKNVTETTYDVDLLLDFYTNSNKEHHIKQEIRTFEWITNNKDDVDTITSQLENLLISSEFTWATKI